MNRFKPALWFVLACIFMDALGFGLIIPVLPRLIGELSPARDVQTYWYGAIMLSYGLMQFISSPVLGALSDRYGRKPLLLTGIFGLAVMQLVPAVSSSLPLILASRIAGGALSANVVVAQAYIADITPAEQHPAAFGKIGAVFGIAFVIGPALGGVLGQIAPQIPFAAAAALCVINFIYGLIVLPESLREPDLSGWNASRLNPFSGLFSLLRSKNILPMIAILGTVYLAQSLMQCTWALYTEFRYGWTPLNIGFSMFVLGLFIAGIQGGLLPRLLKRFSRRSLVHFALVSGALALFGIAMSDCGPLSALLAWLFAIVGISTPIIQAAVSHAVPPNYQGTALGALSSLNSFSGAIAPVISTPLLVFTVKETANTLERGLPYFISAALLVTGAAILLSVPQNKTERGKNR